MMKITLLTLPDIVDSATDDEKAQDDDVMIDNGMPDDVCGKMQVQIIFLNGEDNNDEVEDDNNVKK